MYVQALFMNSGLILGDNQDIDWIGSFAPITIVSTIVWLAILIVPQILARRNQHVADITVIAVSLCLILVQTFGIGSLFFSSNLTIDSMGPSTATEKGLLKVSDKNNVIYLILDHFDERELDHLVEDNPHLLDFLPNSTVYTNTMETMTPTELALPYMMTAVLPETGEDIDDSYRSRRYMEGTFLQALEDTGYKIGLYTEALCLDYLSNEQAWEKAGCHTENVYPIGTQYLDWKGTLKILAKAALYRDLPWVLKPRFAYTTPDLNGYMIVGEEEAPDPNGQPYVNDNDIAFYHKLLNTGLSIDQGDEKGIFRLIHQDGNHWPWTKDENLEEVYYEDGKRDADAIGSLKIAETYVQQLKELGVYDKSTIIITADHGDWETHALATDVSVPILIVKPATDGNAQDAPKFSDAPVSHEDLFATILEAMDADGSQFGNTLSEIEAQYGANPAARTRETYMASAGEGFATVTNIFLFTVQGQATNWDDWTYTGTTWHIEDGA